MMMIYHSKTNKKRFDNLINVDIGDKIKVPDFKSGQIEINNDFSVLSKSVHEALTQQRDNAYKKLAEELGYTPINVVIESYPTTMEELPNGNLLFTTNFRFKEAKQEKEKKEMQNKYKLLKDETRRSPHGDTLYRIEALKDFYGVRKGDKGGYIQGQWNLSQSGDCWIHDEACVWQNAVVSEDATIRDEAKVYGEAIVRGDTEVHSTVNVFEHAIIDDCAVVGYSATVKGNAHISEGAYICDNSIIRGNAKVLGDSRIRGRSEIYGNAVIKNDSSISDSSCTDFVIVDGARVVNSKVYDNAIITGGVEVENAKITKDAVVKSNVDYLTLKNNWTSGRTFTYTHSNKTYVVGCFTGTGEELIEKAYKDSETSGKFYETAVKYVENIYKLHEELGNLENNNSLCMPF